MTVDLSKRRADAANPNLGGMARHDGPGIVHMVRGNFSRSGARGENVALPAPYAGP